MAKYRKKPVEIEAFRLGIDYIPDWFIDKVTSKDIILHGTSSGFEHHDDTNADIKTLEGVMHANFGDFVIKGIKGEIYPCKADIFYETYEPAETDVKKTIPNEWISVYSNEKPKDRREYFVAYVFGDSDMHFYGAERYHAYEGNGIVNGPHFSNEGVNGMRVTHWMQIPKLPKNEEKEK